MPDNTQSYYDPDVEAIQLVKPDVPVKHFLGAYVVDVPEGQQHRLFKNGKHLRDLGPGRYTWTDLNPLARYTKSELDDSSHTTRPIIARGTIPGNAGEPPCQVELPLRLTYQLGTITTLLRTEQPIKRLEYLVKDHIATQIGNLRYDPSRQWVTQLKDGLERWLQLNANSETGLTVTNVLIEEPRNQSEVDRALLKRYNTIKEVEIERIRGEGTRAEGIANAQAAAQAADALGINRALWGAATLPGGDKVLEAQAHALDTQINATGDTTPPEIMPPHAAAALPAAGGSSAGAAPSGPGRVSNPYPGPAANPAPGASNPGATPGAAPYATPTEPPPASPAPTLDQLRVESEVRKLKEQGYSVQPTPAQTSDGGGGVYGYNITVFPDATLANGWRSVQFALSATYPQTAPRVLLARERAAPAWQDDLTILKSWDSRTSLADVLAAVLRTVPPSTSV